MKQVILLFIFITTLVSCNKKPMADFSTDKAEYKAGETIQLTNSSVDAEKYKWTFPDGQTSIDKDAKYYLTKDLDDQELSIQLQAYSKNGELSDFATKLVKVKQLSGNLVIYCSSKRPPSSSYYQSGANVYVDGKYSGLLSDSVPEADCFSNKSLTVVVKPGIHNIEVNGVGSRQAIVTENECNKVAF
jgi:PKD repeat protein